MGGSGVGEFLRALWEDATGYAELRLIAPDKKVHQTFYAYPDELDKLLADAAKATGHFNVYYGVCLRFKKGGKSEDVAQAHALWVDIDFKTTPQDKADEFLRTFPIRPSIGIATGGGYHIYWLFKESTTTEELKKIQPLNRSIAKITGGDPHSTDVARILRMPETLNIKYDPPRPCSIVVFRPELRYTLSDFDNLPLPPAAPPVPARETTSADPAGAAGVEDFEEYNLPKELIHRLVPLVEKMWIEGHRHEVALYLAGMMAKHGVTLDSTRELVQKVCTAVGDTEVEDRMRAAIETFAKAKANPKNVGGSLRLETEVIDELPDKIRTAAKKAFDIVRRTIQHLRKEAEENSGDFKIIPPIVKLSKQPALWDITVQKDGKAYVIRCDTETQLSLKKFDIVCRDEHNLILPLLKNSIWRKMLAKATVQEKVGEGVESTAMGYLKQTIRDFEARAQLSKAPEMTLQNSPIRLDTGEIVMRLGVLLRFLKNEAIENRRREEVISALRDLGYKDEQQRVGKGGVPVRVWVKVNITEKASGTSENGSPSKDFEGQK